MKSITIITIFVILLSVQISNAGYLNNVSDAVKDTASDAGAGMVKKGFDLFAYGIGDSMISLGMSNQTVNETTRSETPNIIFKLLTFSVDPYQFDFVKEWQNVMIIFFVVITLMIISLGGASVIINRTSPDMAYRISWLMDSSAFFDIHKWISTIVIAIIFLLLGTFGIYSYVFG